MPMRSRCSLPAADKLDVIIAAPARWHGHIAHFMRAMKPHLQYGVRGMVRRSSRCLGRGRISLLRALSVPEPGQLVRHS